MEVSEQPIYKIIDKIEENEPKMVKYLGSATGTSTRPDKKGNGYQTEWDKTFASYSSDKGLISRIYKELQNLNTRRTNTPINKQANELNRQLPKEETQMLNKQMG
jgi:hypothetical protein